jgi:hypothetical protein
LENSSKIGKDRQKAGLLLISAMNDVPVFQALHWLAPLTPQITASG